MRTCARNSRHSRACCGYWPSNMIILCVFGFSFVKQMKDWRNDNILYWAQTTRCNFWKVTFKLPISLDNLIQYLIYPIRYITINMLNMWLNVLSVKYGEGVLFLFPWFDGHVHGLTWKFRQYRAFSITGNIRVIYKIINTKTLRLYDIGTHNQVY